MRQCPVLPPFSLLRDLVENEPALLIGSGESSALLNQIPFNHVFNAAVNHAVLRSFSPLVFWQDSGFASSPAVVRHFRERNTLGVFSSKTANRLNYALPGFFALKEATITPETVNRGMSRRTRTIAIERFEQAGVSSGCHGAILLHLMGFAPIYLIGFDATPGREYRYAAKHPVHGWRNEGAERKIAENQFAFFSRFAEELNLVNLSDSEWAQQQDPQKVLPGLLKNREEVEKRIRQIHKQAGGE